VALGQAALVLFWEAFQQPAGDDQAQHAVAQEFQPLIMASGGAGATANAGHTGVGHRLQQVAGLDEGVAQGLGQGGDISTAGIQQTS
jgi:hypothetical protein